MTCIVGMVSGSNIYLGGDRLHINGWYAEVNEAKIIQHRNGLVGVAGESSYKYLVKEVPLPEPMVDGNYCDFLWRMFVKPLHESMPKDDNSSSIQTMIVWSGRLFETDPGFYLREIKDFSAIGSATDLARGSMYNKDLTLPNLVDSLRAAEYYSIAVRGPFDVFTVNNRHVTHDTYGSTYEDCTDRSASLG